MTKLTTERLDEIANIKITEFSDGTDTANGAYQSVGSSEIVLMARQLLAYEQAAKNPAAKIKWDGSEFSVTNVSSDFYYGTTDVYLAPVLPKQPEPKISFYRDGIIAAAKWVENQRDAYDNEHGQSDPDTGAFEFGNDAQLEYSTTLSEIAEGIRSLHPASAQPVSEPFKSPDGKDSAISEAVAAIYLNDSTDYLPALFSVVNALSPEIFSLLLSNEKAAFDATRLPAAPAQESE